MSLNIIIKGGGKNRRSDEEYLAKLKARNEEEARIEKVTYKDRQRDVAKKHQHLKGESLKHMKPVGAIDARTFLRWEQQAPGFWNDDSSRNKFYKDNPECRIQPD
tara:strand:+ start:254 stop:568 length:315 start_codon:yes stop_codon:yes gene_type:complete